MPAKPIVPLIVAVALFMENMDSTVIATSLPAIAADIGTSPLTLKLAVTSYLLSLAVFIPVSGWTADRFGARTVFRGAIAVFMLGSIGCALSGSLSEFVVARIVEGMGGAMMTPVARLILVRSVDRRELINAMVWVTLPALIGPLIGPALGGFITTYISWHWIFLINIPIGLAGIALATIFIEDVPAQPMPMCCMRGAPPRRCSISLCSRSRPCAPPSSAGSSTAPAWGQCRSFFRCCFSSASISPPSNRG